MQDTLRSFREVVQEISEKYSIPFEIAESILIDWTKILYEGMTNIKESDLSNFEG